MVCLRVPWDLVAFVRESEQLPSGLNTKPESASLHPIDDGSNLRDQTFAFGPKQDPEGVGELQVKQPCVAPSGEVVQNHDCTRRQAGEGEDFRLPAVDIAGERPR